MRGATTPGLLLNYEYSHIINFTTFQQIQHLSHNSLIRVPGWVVAPRVAKADRSTVKRRSIFGGTNSASVSAHACIACACAVHRWLHINVDPYQEAHWYKSQLISSIQVMCKIDAWMSVYSNRSVSSIKIFKTYDSGLIKRGNSMLFQHATWPIRLGSHEYNNIKSCNAPLEVACPKNFEKF